MKSRLFLLFLLAAASGAAGAQSMSQSFYGGCLAQARQERSECLRSRHIHENCGAVYRYEKDRCWSTFQSMGRNDPYYGGQPPRFEPIPIPQRPVYILPGMR